MGKKCHQGVRISKTANSLVEKIKMKFWCLLLALGLIQVATFVENVEAKSKDSDGDGIEDEDDDDDDNDGIPDSEDLDDDGDGVPDHQDEDHPDFNDELWSIIYFLLYMFCCEIV